jgi:uncharacterized RDD family membrane protein YckC
MKNYFPYLLIGLIAAWWWTAAAPALVEKNAAIYLGAVGDHTVVIANHADRGDDPTFVIKPLAPKFGAGEVAFVAGAESPREFRGEVIGIAPNDKDGGAQLIFADGSVFELAAPDAPELTEILAPQNNLRFLAVAQVIPRAIALTQDLSGAAQFYELSEGETGTVWRPSSIMLPFIELPRHFAMSSYGEKLVLAWRPGSQERSFSGWQGAIFDLNDRRPATAEWEYLSPPPHNSATGTFALAPYNDGFLLAQEIGAALRLAQYENGVWTQRALAQFDEKILNEPLNDLALNFGADGLTLARASGAGGVDYVFAPQFPDDLGKAQAAPRRDGAEWLPSMWWIIVAALVGLALLRGWAMKLVQTMPTPNGETLDARQLLSLVKVGGIASVLDRALAILIDGIICLPLPVAFVALTGAAPNSPELHFLWLGGLVIYCTIAETIWGATPGKALFKLRVRSINGGAAMFGQVLARNLLRFVDFFPLTLGGIKLWYLIAAVSVYVTSRTQRVGDYLAGTVVRYHVPLRKRDIVLASGSPQRRALLEILGLKFATRPANINEQFAPNAAPAEVAVSLAETKALAVANADEGRAIVIGADTLVVVDNQILGKPASPDAARAMLRRLANRKHQVITAVALIDQATGQAVSDKCV